MSGAVLAWLVTWTWQAATLTVISMIALRLARRTNASTRYMVWWITLVGVLALAVIPWSWPIVPESAFGSEEASPATLLGASPGRSRFGLVEIPPVPIWIVGVGAVLWAAYSTQRLTALVRSLARLRVVKRRCAPVPRRFEQRLSLWISVRHEGRSARLCLSEDVATGCMLGLGPPVIALPRGLVAALTAADLDRVVLHEYGHVQRRDDWTTFAQALIEALLGWHPAIRWIGRNLRFEREVACDDWVILQTRAARDYASSLTKLAGLALKQRALPFASPALRSRRELVGRVERLLDPMRNVAIRPIWSVLATGTLALGGGVVLLGQTPPIMTVGPAAVLPVVPRLDASAPNLRPLVASSRGLASTGETSGVGARISTAQSGKLSPPPRIVNQTTLLAHAELSALRGLTPPDSLRPALAGRHFKPVLRSRELAVDAKFTFPMNVPFPKPTELGSRYKAMDTGPGPWGQIASAGQAVGVGASYAGVATAAAFQTVGSSIVRVFVGSR